jgi:epoxide hydrolase-like predicted phosphatase
MQEKYKAIVFDFGNVIINIDLNLTYKAFADFTYKSEEKIKQIFQSNEIFRKYEIGLFDDDEFREVVRQACGFPLNDDEIDIAWNALLLDVPKTRIEYLENLRIKYPIYLLSNTNSLHINKCKQYFRKNFGYSNFLELFNTAFLSYQMGLWKPDYAIYDAVIKEIGVKPNEILFLDDNEDNISAALDMGISAIKIDPPNCFTNILNTLLPDA